MSILLLLTRSAQVSVLGLVNRAGRYPLDTVNMRVSEMIAIAGGVAAAGGDLAILTGERAGKPFRKEIDIAALFAEKGHDEDIAVAGGDVIYVERAPSVLRLRRSEPAGRLSPRARHDAAAGAGARRRPDAARQRAQPARCTAATRERRGAGDQQPQAR